MTKSLLDDDTGIKRHTLGELIRFSHPFGPRGPEGYATCNHPSFSCIWQLGRSCVARWNRSLDEGARRALQKAIEQEVAEYIDAHAEHLDDAGHRLVVRNDHMRTSNPIESTFATVRLRTYRTKGHPPWSEAQFEFDNQAA
jgi:hypothetical protein